MTSNTVTTISTFLGFTPGVESVIGLNNILLGFMVAGCTGGSSAVLLVPMVVSAACALGNGLGYYIYADNPALNRTVASPFADLAWLVQEAGLNFYSYVILTRILRDGERAIFMLLFWILIMIVTTSRLAILVVRVLCITKANPPLLAQGLAYLHVGYFASIALAECVSAVFLLRKLKETLYSSPTLSRSGSHFRYLIHSTEFRLSTLAIIGITRAVAYPCQFIFGPTGTAGQVDHVATLLESLFPVVMFIDILNSHLKSASESHAPYGSYGNDPAGRPTASLRQLTAQRMIDEQNGDIIPWGLPRKNNCYIRMVAQPPLGPPVEASTGSAEISQRTSTMTPPARSIARQRE